MTLGHKDEPTGDNMTDKREEQQKEETESIEERVSRLRELLGDPADERVILYLDEM